MSYAPRSPDLSNYHTETPVQPSYTSMSVPTVYQGPSYGAYLHPPGGPQQHPLPMLNTKPLARTESSMDDGFTPGPKPRGRRPKKPKVEIDYGTKPAPGVEEGIEVKTKFAVAKIKRIMQADEDVGKVAQVTPTAVCRSSLLIN